MGLTARYTLLGFSCTLAICSLLWVFDLSVLILSPLVFWFVALPTTAVLAFMGCSISGPPLFTHILRGLAVTSGAWFATSAVLMAVLVIWST